jgi:hypothetical protein
MACSGTALAFFSLIWTDMASLIGNKWRYYAPEAGCSQHSDQTRQGYIKWMQCIRTHLLLNLLDFNILFGKFNG